MNKNKKLVLVTLYDDNNIGNRLQNFAMLLVLQRKGAQVSVLNNGYTFYPTSIQYFNNVIKRILGFLGMKKYKRKYHQFIAAGIKLRANKLFDEINIKNVIDVKNEHAFQMDWSEYDLAIAGSDQIWHRWKTDKLELPFYYLEFMPSEKRAAYAASFGFESFPEKDLEQHKQGLRGMKYISCRETSGCKLAADMTGKDIPRVLDPTLLLSASEWRKIEEQASEFSKSQKNYAFIYFLGEQTEEYKKCIRNIMGTKKIDKIIDFSDYMNKDICECGPAGFLSLIDHAEYIFTDSFHCTVFSVLFDKEFTAFRRKQPGFENMFGRIEDLLASTGKLDHIYGGTSRKATNDFEKLYTKSMQYIDMIVECNS